MSTDVFPACMSVHYMHVWCSQKLKHNIVYLGTGKTDSCDPHLGCLEPNPEPLEEQAVYALNS